MYSDTEYYFDTALIYIIFNVCYYNITLAIQAIPGCTSNTENENVITYNITELDHIINYTISVAAINCAGTGDCTSTLVIIEAIGKYIWHAVLLYIK